MLTILLCLLFPPAIPFVIIWRMGRGRKTQRLQLAATRNLVAITAVPVALRSAVLERRAASRSMARMTKMLVVTVILLAIIIAIAGHS